jgi:NADH:ubiquinone oxidoreductase subunit F (NADH-binding)
MQDEEIIAKLKSANLLGRGGAGFAVHQKWQMVKEAPGEKKYVICNASEGEPDVFKDGWLFEHKPEDIVNGIELALKAVGGDEAIIYLNHQYFRQYRRKLKRIIGKRPISLFLKQGGYLAGEETTLIASIEGRRREPALKPPFPPQKGLFGCPTLINNVETFYYAAKITEDKYNGDRLYSVSGEAPNPGVYELPLQETIESILNKTQNWPEFDFFVQVGGGASGEISLPAELNKPASGTASIHIYNRAKTDPYLLLKRWTQFFLTENCDKCAPCREGVYRLNEMILNKKLNSRVLDDLYFALENTSFCPLGHSVPTPFRSLIEKIIMPGPQREKVRFHW